MINKRFAIKYIIFLAFFVINSGLSPCLAKRAIPSNNLAYPVLNTIPDHILATAFYLRNDKHLYLMTAKHVLFSWFFWRLVVVLGTILTVFWGIYSFRPKVSLFPGVSLDPQNAMRGPFILKNESFLAIHNIRIAYEDVDLLDASSNSTFHIGSINNLGYKIKRLASGKSSFVDVERLIKTYKPTFDEASLTIRVSYRPSFIFWSLSSTFSFETKKSSSGEINWYPVAD